MIGSLNCVHTLGRFDIAHALNQMSRYSMAPRKGHLEAVKRIFGYLRARPCGQIIVDDEPEPSIRSKATINDGFNWTEFYQDTCEDIPDDMPKPEGKLATLTCYVDADHARDKVTRRSVTGIILMVNNTPMAWMSKRQKTVEVAAFGSEMIAARIAVEMLIEWRDKLRMLGLNLEEKSWLVGDNMSVTINTTLPSSALKKKHLACNYHKVRETIAAGFVIFGHINSEDNISDMCTKPLAQPAFEKLTGECLFRKPETLIDAKAQLRKF